MLLYDEDDELQMTNARSDMPVRIPMHCLSLSYTHAYRGSEAERQGAIDGVKKDASITLSVPPRPVGLVQSARVRDTASFLTACRTKDYPRNNLFDCRWCWPDIFDTVSFDMRI